MNKKQLQVTRDVTPAECDWLRTTIAKGTVVTEFQGCTYGCVSPAGVAVTLSSDPTETPFLELPITALGPATGLN